MLKFLSYMASMALFFLIVLIIVVTYGITKINITIPDYRQLANYEPPVTTRLFAGDGQVMMEYAAEKRLFVPIDMIPDLVDRFTQPNMEEDVTKDEAVDMAFPEEE